MEILNKKCRKALNEGGTSDSKNRLITLLIILSNSVFRFSLGTTKAFEFDIK